MSDIKKRTVRALKQAYLNNGIVVVASLPRVCEQFESAGGEYPEFILSMIEQIESMDDAVLPDPPGFTLYDFLHRGTYAFKGVTT